MRKRFPMILGAVALLLVLFFPVRELYKDGGTRTCTALTCKVIVWNRMLDTGAARTGVEVHLFPNSFRRLDGCLNE